jgi:hypothetical protein
MTLTVYPFFISFFFSSGVYQFVATEVGNDYVEYARSNKITIAD